MQDAPLVRLALSLHAPTQELRCQIVPSAKAFPLHKLIAALDTHLSSEATTDLVLVEYVMLQDVNDSKEVAHQLGSLLFGKEVVRRCYFEVHFKRSVYVARESNSI